MADSAPREDEEKKSKKGLILIILLLAIIVALVVVLVVFVLGGEDEAADEGTAKIGYAEGTVALDQDSLQKAVDEMYANANNGVPIQYQNDAFSEDGVNFTCLIGNPERSQYDMFIAIYADEELTDELYLSQLLRPGTAFESLTLERALPAGDHRVYMAVTQVEEDLDTIHAQVIITLDFHVTE